MSSPFVILANSAMPIKIKRNSLVQEAIRCLRNTKRSLGWDVKARILSEFCNKMKVCYGHKKVNPWEVLQNVSIVC